MGSTVYSVINHCENATITPSSENATYPKDNLIDASASKPFKFNASGDGDIVVNLGSALAVQIIGIINHNFPTGATITIDYNSSDSWPNDPTTLTYNETDIFYVYSSTMTYQYWKLDLTDMGTTTGYIGEFFLGARNTMPTPDFSFNFRRVINNIKHVTHYGIAYERNRHKGMQINLAYGYLTSTDRTSLQDFYDLVKYSNESRNEEPTPFVWLKDEDTLDDNNSMGYWRISNELSIIQQTYLYFKVEQAFTLIEAARGYVQ